MFLKCSQIYQENTCFGIYFLISCRSKVTGLRPANFIKKETPTQLVCELCEIFKNTFLQNSSGWLLLSLEFFDTFQNIYFIEHSWTAACKHNGKTKNFMLLSASLSNVGQYASFCCWPPYAHSLTNVNSLFILQNQLWYTVVGWIGVFLTNS